MGNGPLKSQNGAKASVFAAGYEEERAAWIERRIFGRDDIGRDGGALSAHTMGCRTLRGGDGGAGGCRGMTRPHSTATVALAKSLSDFLPD